MPPLIDVPYLWFGAMRLCTKGFECFMTVLGPLLVAFATALFAVITYTFFVYIMPFWTETYSMAWWTTTSVGVWLLFNILFNYFLCVLTPPGQPSPSYRGGSAVAAASSLGRLEADSDPRNGGEFSTFCKRCDAPKPPRTHHCHICKKCVMKMDHHCPWVASCVGHFNYRYFVLFNFYLFVGCIFAGTVSFPLFWQHVVENKTAEDPMASENLVLFMFVISVAIGFAIGLMLTWHLYLTVTNQTTIEFYRNRTREKRMKLNGRLCQNEHDLGRRRNWEAVFGKGSTWWSWMMPSLRAPETDGTVFPTVYEPNLGVGRHYV